MKPPCEVVSKYLLPAVRALIARKLIEKYDYTQVDAASKLGLTQSAMSRYIALDRGQKIGNIKEVRRLTGAIAENIAKSQLSQEEVTLKMCGICTAFRKSGKLCGFHKHIVPTTSKKCRVCYEL